MGDGYKTLRKLRRDYYEKCASLHDEMLLDDNQILLYEEIREMARKILRIDPSAGEAIMARRGTEYCPECGRRKG